MLDGSVSAELVSKRFLVRVLHVVTPQRVHEVIYDGHGLGYESIYLDGDLAVRRSGWRGRMSQVYEFQLDATRRAKLSVALPVLGEFLLFFDLNYTCLEIDGAVVYQEGQEPRRKLQVTSDTDL